MPFGDTGADWRIENLCNTIIMPVVPQRYSLSRGTKASRRLRCIHLPTSPYSAYGARAANLDNLLRDDGTSLYWSRLDFPQYL